jgi:hypothetical protein
MAAHRGVVDPSLTPSYTGGRRHAGEWCSPPSFMSGGAQVAGGAMWPSRPHDINGATGRPMAPSHLRCTLKVARLPLVCKERPPVRSSPICSKMRDATEMRDPFFCGRISDETFSRSGCGPSACQKNSP